MRLAGDEVSALQGSCHLAMPSGGATHVDRVGYTDGREIGLINPIEDLARHSCLHLPATSILQMATKTWA